MIHAKAMEDVREKISPNTSKGLEAEGCWHISQTAQTLMWLEENSGGTGW